MKVQNVKISELKLNEKNPRKINSNDMVKLMRSLEEFGFVDPVIVNENPDRKNIIVGGHQRFKAAKKLGLTEVPVTYVDLKEAEENVLNIALNKISGEWDNEKLPELLIELQDLGADLTLTGFDDLELEDLTKTNKPGQETTEDDFVAVDAYERAKSKSKIKKGDVFILGDHLLMCGDATSSDVGILMSDFEADLMFTDPPYGVSIGGGRTQTIEKKNIKPIANDELRNEDFTEFLIASFKNSFLKENGSFYICYDQKTQGEFVNSIKAASLTFKRTIVWNKNVFGLSGKKGYRPKYELIAFGHKGNDYIWNGDNAQADVWDIPRPTERPGNHPTPKPIELCAKAIKNSSKEKEIVLDLFGGTGSTLMACEQLNRKCRMLELDPVYCQVIIERWEKLTNKKASKV